MHNIALRMHRDGGARGISKWFLQWHLRRHSRREQSGGMFLLAREKNLTHERQPEHNPFPGNLLRRWAKGSFTAKAARTWCGNNRHRSDSLLGMK